MRKPADRLRGGCVRHKNELSVLQFAPTAGIPISEFDEIDRALQFLPPYACLDLCLSGIDLQERSGQDYREERIVAQAQIPVERFPQIELPNQRHRDFSPHLYQSR